MLTLVVWDCSEISSHGDGVARSVTEASAGPRYKPRRKLGGVMYSAFGLISHISVKGGTELEQDRWEVMRGQ